MTQNPTQTIAGLQNLDWVVLASYLLLMMALGTYFYREQKTTKDFFLAGRSMSWLPVGLSLVATLFSSISYLAVPSVVQKYGVIFFAGNIVIFLCVPVVNHIFIPIYHRMQVYTAYEYLERRFDVRVRCLTSGIFILWRICWMATAVYAPSLALWAATGQTVNLYATIVVLGIFATVYTALGGMKAVIWTDVLQFCVLFGGIILAAAWMIFHVPGGMAEIFHGMARAGKMTLVIPVPEMDAASGVFAKLKAYFCIQNRVTLLAVLASNFVGHLAFYTVDQATVQRYFTTRNLAHARKAFWLNTFSVFTILACLTFLGMALFSYYSTFVLPQHIAGMEFQNDWKYPYFIATVMPAGVAGLLIAALYAATMSSVDSGINSCTTAFLVDFWQRLKYGEVRPSEGAHQHQQLVQARILTVVLGTIVTVLACFVGRLGDLIEITNKIVNSFAGPMFAIFLLGMLSRRAQSVGVCIGALLSMLVMGWLVFGTTLNFLWPSTFGLAVALAAGYGISLLERPPSPEKLRWTFASQRQRWNSGQSRAE